MDVDLSDEAAATCSTFNAKCGGEHWSGSTECCDDFATCYIKDGLYSQCRTNCPSGWDCETLPPTALPTNSPTLYPTSEPTTSLPTVSPTSSAPTTPAPSIPPPTYSPTVRHTDAPTTLEYKITADEEKKEIFEDVAEKIEEDMGSCAVSMEQCGGDEGYAGPTTCCEDSTSCYAQTDTYSECLPYCPDDWLCADEDGTGKSTSSCVANNQKCGGGTSSTSECCDSAYSCYSKDSTYFQCRTNCPDGWDCIDSSDGSSSQSASAPYPTPNPTYKPTNMPSRVPGEPSRYPTPSPSPEPTARLFDQVRFHEWTYDTWFVELMTGAFFLGVAISFVRTRRQGAPKPWLDKEWEKEMEMDHDPNQPMWEMRFWQCYKLNRCCKARKDIQYPVDEDSLPTVYVGEETRPLMDAPLERRWATKEAIRMKQQENAMLKKQLEDLDGSGQSSQEGPKAPNLLAGLGGVKLKKNRGPAKSPKENKGFSKASGGSGSGIPEDPEEDLEEGWKIDTEKLPTTDEEIKQMFQENIMLKQQLKQLGAVAVEAVPLAVAERRMRDAVRRLLEGDERAEADVERWDRSIRMNPEYIKREEARVKKWEAEQKEANMAALKHMRHLIPADVNNCSEADLVRRGLCQSSAKRIIQRKTLWLTRYAPDYINKIHAAELMTKYTHQGLDIIEMRAVYAAVPPMFQNDDDGKKKDWRDMIRQRLQDLCERERKGSLSKNDARHTNYKKVHGRRLFDGHKGFIRTHTSKGDAFGATEKPVITRTVDSSQFGPKAKLTRARSVMVSKTNDPSAGRPQRPPAMAGLLGDISKRGAGGAEEEDRPKPSFLASITGGSPKTGKTKRAKPKTFMAPNPKPSFLDGIASFSQRGNQAS